MPNGYDFEFSDNSIYCKFPANSATRLRIVSEPYSHIASYKDGSKSQRVGWLVIVKAVKQGGGVEKTVKVLQAGKTIATSIKNLALNEDWGDPTGYDVTVNREGSTKEDTKYTVTPHPNCKPISDEDRKLVTDSGLNLKAVCDGTFTHNSPPPASAPEEYDAFNDE